MTDWLNKTHVGDCRNLLETMAAAGVRAQTCVTSPPYFGLRDYGMEAQIGIEASPAEYVAQLVDVFRAVRDVLADDGTLWLNLGDSYASGGRGGNPTEATSGLQGGHASQRASMVKRSLAIPEGLKPKDLVGIPWRVAFALQADGWYLRSDIIWHKPNPMPESVTDRPTKAHEYLFLLAKSERYYYDAEAIQEPAKAADIGAMDGGSQRNADGSDANSSRNSRPGRSGNEERKYPTDYGRPDDHRAVGVPWEGFTRNRRSVWSIVTTPFAGAHFATFPRALIEPCIVAGARPGDTVLDPFMGSGTTGQVATDLGRNFIGCELNSAYVDMHEMRRTTIGMPI